MPRPLEYYESIAKEAIDQDAEKIEMFQKFDAMEACEYELPAEMKVLPGIRTVMSTEPVDSLKAAIRVFSTAIPSIELHPLAPGKGENERMDGIEQAILWHFRRACAKPISPLREIVGQATRYMRCCFQVEYLPYSLKGRTDTRSKTMRKYGDFVWIPYDPKDVHATYDQYGLESVVMCTEMTAHELAKTIGEDNPGVKKLLREVRSGNDNKDGAADRRAVVLLYDYTDWDDRVKWCSLKSGSMKNSSGSSFEIMRKAHKLPFVNWVFVEGDNPLLKSTVDSYAWEDAIVLGTLQNWLVVQSAAHPGYATVTPSGRGVDINYTSGVSTLDLKSGEAVNPLPPRILDPRLTEIYVSAVAKIRNTIGTKYLQNLDFPANTPFSTVNALITASLSNLNDPKRLSEAAIAEGFMMNLRWIAYTKEPLIGYRSQTLDEDVPTLSRGAQMMVSANTNPTLPGEFSVGDPEDIVISVELQADTATDKQARINNGVLMHERLKVPISRVHEEVGIENSKILVEEWMQEQFDDAEMKAELTRIQGQAELELQQQAMEAQQQAAQQQQQDAQQQAQQQGMGQQGPPTQGMSPEQTQFETAQGSGFAPNMGGQPPQMMAPGATREQISGMDMSGQELAGQ
jgi:hypothetical protein